MEWQAEGRGGVVSHPIYGTLSSNIYADGSVLRMGHWSQ